MINPSFCSGLEGTAAWSGPLLLQTRPVSSSVDVWLRRSHNVSVKGGTVADFLGKIEAASQTGPWLVEEQRGKNTRCRKSDRNDQR